MSDNKLILATLLIPASIQSLSGAAASKSVRREFATCSRITYTEPADVVDRHDKVDSIELHMGNVCGSRGSYFFELARVEGRPVCALFVSEFIQGRQHPVFMAPLSLPEHIRSVYVLKDACSAMFVVLLMHTEPIVEANL